MKHNYGQSSHEKSLNRFCIKSLPQVKKFVKRALLWAEGLRKWIRVQFIRPGPVLLIIKIWLPTPGISWKCFSVRNMFAMDRMEPFWWIHKPIKNHSRYNYRVKNPIADFMKRFKNPWGCQLSPEKLLCWFHGPVRKPYGVPWALSKTLWGFHEPI